MGNSILCETSITLLTRRNSSVQFLFFYRSKTLFGGGLLDYDDDD